MWSSLVITDDLCRYQVTNCYMDRAGLINGGAASGQNDFSDAITMTARNKQAGDTDSDKMSFHWSSENSGRDRRSNGPPTKTTPAQPGRSRD